MAAKVSNGMKREHANADNTTFAQCVSARGETDSAIPTNFWRMWRWRREFAQKARDQQAENALQTLAALHRAEIPAHRAFWALRQVHTEVRPLLDEFNRRLRGHSLPLPRKTQATLQRYLAILEHLAYCYFLIANQEALSGRPSRERIASALHASLELRGEVLIACAKVYTTPPSGFWSAVHSAYRTAERVDAAAKRVKSMAPGHGPRPRSAAAAYRQLLSFAVAQVESLPRSQMTQVYNALASWVTLDTVARDPTSEDPDQPLIWVDIDADAPPRLTTREHVPGRADMPNAGQRIIEVTAIADALKALAGSEPDEQPTLAPSDALSPSAIEHVLRHFSAISARHAERESSDEPGVEVKSGLDEIQSSLSYIVTDDEEDAPEMHLEFEERLKEHRLALLKTVAPVTETRSGHDSGRASASFVKKLVAVPPAPNYPTTDTDASRPRPSQQSDAKLNWTLVDESDSGLGLQWNTTLPARISVGQLLAYRIAGKNGETPVWRLAMVRRVNHEDLRTFQVGAEKISGQPSPAVVRREPRNINRKRKRQQESSDPALFIDGDDTSEATVILPPYLYTTGEVVEIDLGGETLRVELTAVRINSATFTQFCISHASPRRKLDIAEPVEEIVLWGDPTDHSTIDKDPTEWMDQSSG